MLKLTKQRYSTIGIDVGARMIKAVQLKQIGQTTELIGAAIMPLSAEGLTADRVSMLREVLYRQGFVGNRITLNCPMDRLHSEVIELPSKNSGVPLDQIARVEIQRICKLDTSAFEMAYWELPTTARAGNATSVMAVAVKEVDVIQLVTLFEDCGFDVESIGTTSNALARVGQQYACNEIVALINMDSSCANIVLAYEGVVVYQRHLSEMGYDLLCRSIGAELGLDEVEADCILGEVGCINDMETNTDRTDAEQRLQTLIVQHFGVLVDELQDSMAYARHRYPTLQIKQVLLTGTGTTIKLLDEHISTRIGMPSKNLIPVDILKVTNVLLDQGVQSQYMVATGLAMGGLC